MKKLLYILLFVPMFGFCQIIFISSQGEYNSDSSVFTLNNIYSDLIYPSTPWEEDAIELSITFDNIDYEQVQGCLDNSNEFCFITSYSINFEILPPGFDTWYFYGSMPANNFGFDGGSGSITFHGSTPYTGQYNINYTIDVGVQIQGTVYEITLPYTGGNSIIDEEISYNYDLINMDLPELVMNIEYGNPILGCTNINYVEYNALANVDDGSCQTQISHLYLYSLIDSLSNQIQNLQESIAAESEEEIVSDVNSFDVLNPLSYNGEFEVVYINDPDVPYTVPEGKTLIINHGSSLIDGVITFSVSWAYAFDLGPNVGGSFSNSFSSSPGNVGWYDSNLKLPIIVSENKLVLPPAQGILIDKVYPSVHHNFEDSNYEVPNNHTLVITHMVGETSLYIDTMVWSFSNQGLGSINNPLYVSDSISASSGSFHGFLIDNSNYTYATDYELIDALNEGMDSLSTLSEEVVLENDSISSQNAILTNENEALMAIDYNFDSLQYVADFLSSQVFELQQELLVPNIDVDMAIGWNMIGFSCPEVNSAENALNDIVEELIILKDNNGLVYLPEWNFNGIGDLTPGYGYQLKVTDYILDFNICD